jgi:hypothetical protein
MMPTFGRIYDSERIMLRLNGVDAGLLRSVDGGRITADVIVGTGSKGFRPKQLGPPRIEPFTVECDLSMDQAIYDWIALSWTDVDARRDGSILEADHSFNVRTERQFRDALISEVTISELDISLTKETAYLAVKFQPDLIKLTNGQGKLSGRAAAMNWHKKDFRLEIAGLDCTKVSRIDPFTVKRIATEPGIDFPSLKITLPEASAQTWNEWHQDFVINGNNSDAYERSGALVFLASNGVAELGRINLFNLGIFKIGPNGDVSARQHPANIHLLTAELYCERMDFQRGEVTPNPKTGGSEPVEREERTRNETYEKMLKPALERVASDPQFRDRLELNPLEALNELGVSLDAGTRAELQGKRFSEFWAARRSALGAPIEVRDLPAEVGAPDANGRREVTFAPPYVPVGPVN